MKVKYKVSEIVPFLSGYALLMAITYVYFYSKAIEYDMLKVFTISDYFNYSLKTLFPISLSVFGGYTFSVLSGSIPSLLSKKSSIKFEVKFNIVLSLLLLAVFIILRITNVLDTSKTLLFSSIAVMLFMLQIMKIESLIEKFAPTNSIIFLLIMLLFFTVPFAYIDGKNAIDDPEHAVVILNDEILFESNVLFNLSQDIIVYHKPSESIQQIPRSQIQKIITK